MSTALQPQRLVLDHGTGPVTITTGGVLGPTLRRLAGLPNAATGHVDFRVEATASGMRWKRRYWTADQASSCDTTVSATAAGFVERRGPVALTFVLTNDGQATLHSVRFLGVHLPRHMLASRIESVATEAGLRTTVDIAVGSGRIGLLRYVAELTEVSGEPIRGEEVRP